MKARLFFFQQVANFYEQLFLIGRRRRHRRRFFSFAMEPIDPLHHAEHNKSHNQKIQNCLDKIPVCDRCRSYTDAQIRKRILLYKYSKAPAHIYRNRSFRNKMRPDYFRKKINICVITEMHPGDILISI